MSIHDRSVGHDIEWVLAQVPGVVFGSVSGGPEEAGLTFSTLHDGPSVHLSFPPPPPQVPHLRRDGWQESKIRSETGKIPLHTVTRAGLMVARIITVSELQGFMEI